MEYLTIANWHKFQHYKERNPPWIKLHFELISSSTWVTLDDASRVLAIACMLIASKHDGKVPLQKGYMRRVAYLNSEPDYKPLIDIGFFEDASAMLADASTMQANARPEKEKEADTEKEKEAKITRHKAVIDFGNWPRSLTDDELQAINANRKAKRSAALSQKTADLALVEIRKACTNGLTFDDCIDEWISRGWVGFKAEWLRKDMKPQITDDQFAEMDAIVKKVLG